ncbi:MAG TPA: efflux RND transporter periplasmic adaptor subunit [Terriglobales bacterium]|jgi:Cu(I)/Ag(I) efflux system membrane fusion protein/cobalt-zinc-cadmium efflux system membrane fusion protein|nr:efflux RND transporter periplasmic adaptor subunit [Terriglobales bacterium]
MNEHTYKHAFVIAAALCLTLAAALVYVARSHYPTNLAVEKPSFVVAQGPERSEPSSATVPSPGTSPAALTPVQLSPQRLQMIGVNTALVEMQTVNHELRVAGNVDVNEQRLAYVQTRFPGWIQKVFANATYRYVRRGEPIFTIYSPELVSTEQEYLLAQQNRKSLGQEVHGTAARESDWLLQAAADRLSRFGVPAREIERLERTGTVQHDVAIDSPASGYVTEFNALPNQYVQAETRLYTIVDLSSVWVYANVFQTDVGQLKPGTPAAVTVDAYPGRTFKGQIDQILPQVDAMTRTVRVRLVFSNPGLVLKPGMYVNVRISIPLGHQLVVPASGVLQAGSRDLAFVDRGGGYLEPREIEVGPRLDDHVVVLKGLRAGERIVSSANFLVDSESQLQAAIASFAPSPPGAGPAAAPSVPEQQPSLDLTTEPTPPHRGSNMLHVKLSAADGKPIAGAEVIVTFYIPAMPAMGMAAVKKSTSLSDKGDGAYDGLLQLDSGGFYQVTITAQRNGGTIATRQLSLSVTGGM